MESLKKWSMCLAIVTGLVVLPWQERLLACGSGGGGTAQPKPPVSPGQPGGNGRGGSNQGAPRPGAPGQPGTGQIPPKPPTKGGSVSQRIGALKAQIWQITQVVIRMKKTLKRAFAQLDEWQAKRREAIKKDDKLAQLEAEKRSSNIIRSIKWGRTLIASRNAKIAELRKEIKQLEAQAGK